MIAARFRAIGWVAGVATAALGCYLVSQSVAAERAALVQVDRKIADTRAEITRLSTEIGTRGRMSQIDRWNAETFALQAPGARQFLASETQLASLGHPTPALPINPDVAAAGGAVEQAAFAPRATPAIPVGPEAAPRAVALPEPQPMLRVASYVRAKPDHLALEEAAPAIKVAMVRTADETPRDKSAAPATKPLLKARPRPQSLLPDDIETLAAMEKAGHGARKATK